MHHGITKSMKTAISIDDSLMQEADQAAQNLGLSRSALIADALRQYLQNRRQNQISERLNQVYANEPDPIERRLTRKLKTKLPVQQGW
jgi:metal-responsive CopG/Arc/MetJ family transcriptional regulator